MIKCQIKLYILLFNKITLVYDILSLQSDSLVVPTITPKANNSIEKVLAETFKDYVDLEPRYTNFVLSDININNEILTINYFCLVPYSTNIKQSFLIPIHPNEVSSAAIGKILSKL